MKGSVYNNQQLAGFLEKKPDGAFVFTYDDQYLKDPDLPSISLTLPKSRRQFTSDRLFPFFYGLLAEGINKEIQCTVLKIDEDDAFTRLLRTAYQETIGAITIKEVKDEV